MHVWERSWCCETRCRVTGSLGVGFPLTPLVAGMQSLVISGQMFPAERSQRGNGLSAASAGSQGGVRRVHMCDGLECVAPKSPAELLAGP